MTSETTTRASMVFAQMKRCAEINPNVRRIEDLDSGARLAVTYDPPRNSWGRIDKHALRDAAASSLWWTWTLTEGGETRVLNDERDVRTLLEGGTPAGRADAQAWLAGFWPKRDGL